MHYVITSTLPAQYGGRTKSLLDRTDKLVEKAGMDYTLVTTNYNPFYGEIYKQYYEQEKVPSTVKFINLYDFISKRTYKGTKINHPVEESGLIAHEVKKNKVYRYFENGEYVLYKNFDTEDGSLKIVDHIDSYNRIRLCRKEYNALGQCHRKTNYKQGTTNKLEEIFYDEIGNAYMNKTYNGSKENKLIRLHIFTENGIIEFKTEKDFFRYALELIIEDNSTIINDARLLDKPLIEMEGTNITKISILHSSHLNSNDLLDVKSSYKYLIDHIADLDHLVTLTHDQKKDLLQFIPDEEKIKVIPHSIEASNLTKNVEKDNKFVYIGRLAESKQIDHLIEAYQLRRSELASINFEIYGEGPDRERLQKMIEDNHLEEHISLKGLTNVPEKIFAGAKASFLPSQFEGLPLSIMESLNNGCPVVAYDIRYGPNDLITHGKNGLIVEKDNISALATAMVKVLDIKPSSVYLDKEFREDAFIKNWSKLLKVQGKSRFKIPFFQ
ncbi:glycosyltransferase [Bacillus sp. RAR_GA_16]|uniref:glycosyltransferase n=1 Tax=Bacillus sp. RAR_GA_16 TaxID=2876774 RepID=UPI001CCD6331|nr:glycosyltransferase [Bacillus sp. RAR_GA_16]MCA0170466.1 glycosyltransferase [Bacillus sp. RAR_GA_16]